MRGGVGWLQSRPVGLWPCRGKLIEMVIGVPWSVKARVADRFDTLHSRRNMERRCPLQSAIDARRKEVAERVLLSRVPLRLVQFQQLARLLVVHSPYIGEDESENHNSTFTFARCRG